MTNQRQTRSGNILEYKRPDSLSNILDLLKNNTGNVRILAGGTDLILQIRQRLVSLSAVIDVKNVPELNALDFKEDGTLHIGAAVPLSRIIKFLSTAKKWDLLMQACSVIGSRQIRNRGTIGGNICNAAPSADSAPVLMCLDSQAIIASIRRTRKVNLNEFFSGPGKTVVDPDELLMAIEIPEPPAHSTGFYLHHTLREEMDITVAGAAALVVSTPDKSKVKEARIALGAVAPVPLRARNAETLLARQTLTQSVIARAAETAAQEASPISDVRASAEYRRELVKIQVQRALQKCSEGSGLGTAHA